MRQLLASRLPTFTLEEKRKLQNKLDFIGINHYTTIYVKDCMFSPCKLDEVEGNALVYTTAERDGILIGAPVRTKITNKRFLEGNNWVTRSMQEINVSCNIVWAF